jgi:glycosyltransferase involved in cell wall biosynthesis
MTFTGFLSSPIELILVLTIFLLWIIQVWYYLHYYAGIIRKSAGKSTLSEYKPPVSVIICARNEAENLEKNLPLILKQKYPEFQVVVVNDASIDDTEDVLMRLENSAPNLYHTFVPEGVQNVSARKMSTTIGIKAAKYDYLLFTDPDCIPQSDEWISCMMSQFDEKCGLVLGYSSFTRNKGFLNVMAAYDSLFSAIQFLGFALSGNAFMGLPSNLAYRKDLFFRNKGFASHLYLNSGEDDLFIEEISNSQNTRISISPESKIIVQKENFRSFWRQQKLNHFSTSACYKVGTKIRLKFEMLSRCFFYVSFLALIIYGLITRNFLLIILSGGLFLLRYAMQMVVVNKSAKQLDEEGFYLTLPLFDIALPFVNFIFWLSHLTQRNNDYTRRVLR